MILKKDEIFIKQQILKRMVKYVDIFINVYDRLKTYGKIEGQHKYILKYNSQLWCFRWPKQAMIALKKQRYTNLLRQHVYFVLVITVIKVLRVMLECSISHNIKWSIQVYLNLLYPVYNYFIVHYLLCCIMY